MIEIDKYYMFGNKFNIDYFLQGINFFIIFLYFIIIIFFKMKFIFMFCFVMLNDDKEKKRILNDLKFFCFKFLIFLNFKYICVLLCCYLYFFIYYVMCFLFVFILY